MSLSWRTFEREPDLKMNSFGTVGCLFERDGLGGEFEKSGIGAALNEGSSRGVSF
jgi:hypothetical protein